MQNLCGPAIRVGLNISPIELSTVSNNMNTTLDMQSEP